MILYITTNGIGNAWVAAELQVISSTDIPFELHSMRPPHQNFFGSEWADTLNKNTHLLYPIPFIRLMRSLFSAPFFFGKRFFQAKTNAVFGRRENFRARVAAFFHFLVACDWACYLKDKDIHLIHSQWIQSNGTIGMYAAWLLGVPFSFTGHAVDLFRDRVALDDKIRRAEFIVCISNFHKDFYIKNGAQPEKLIVVYCGIDVTQFEFKQKSMVSPVHILSLGRLIEKKGFEDLIDACEILKKKNISLKCTIAGDGPLEESLKRRIKSLDLDNEVHVTGKALLQEELADFMHQGDIFAQPCVWSKDNDVDGTPRTLMEAMACGLPSISTRIAGIPDIIIDGESGLLVEPNDPESLAQAIQKIVEEPGLADKLSSGGRKQIEKGFMLPECVNPLVDRFRSVLHS